jgi:hypothetical protein
LSNSGSYILHPRPPYRLSLLPLGRSPHRLRHRRPSSLPRRSLPRCDLLLRGRRSTIRLPTPWVRTALPQPLQLLHSRCTRSTALRSPQRTAMCSNAQQCTVSMYSHCAHRPQSTTVDAQHSRVLARDTVGGCRVV